MPESVTFTTPYSKVAPATTATLVQLDMSMELGRIYAVLKGDSGERFEGTWSDAAGENATTLMRALNKANLSTKSLQRRVIEQGVADGKWPALTINGVPD